MTSRWLAVLGVLLASSGAACKARAPQSSVVYVRVLDEAKQPVRDADIMSGGKTIARTDDAGRAEVAVSGKEGASFQVEVRCPMLYRSPGEPIVIRRFDAHQTSPEYVARCSKTRHTLVVAVRTLGAANMPVLHLGKEVARTDESGSAHVLIEGLVRERIDLQLATTAPKHAKLHPQNPVGSFEVSETDEVKVFDVKFTEDKAPRARAATRQGPKAF